VNSCSQITGTHVNSLHSHVVIALMLSAFFHIVFNTVCTAGVDSVNTNQQSDVVDNTLSAWKLGLIGGATVGGFVVGHGVLNTLWWKGDPVDFHVNSKQDYTYALNADKFGHAFFAFSTATIYSELFRWSGMDSTSSMWMGVGVSMAYQTYIEMRDGFSRDYGFSYGDVGSNIFGASLAAFKHYYPELRPIDLQVSFWPSGPYRQGAYQAIIDDYESTTHWLAVSVYDYLPYRMQRWFPPWIGLAIGHSVENIVDGQSGKHALYLSLDWNLQRIEGIPSWLGSILRVLHLYHLPAPAVKVLPNVVWYGLRF
jgi:hypothetical protein